VLCVDEYLIFRKNVLCVDECLTLQDECDSGCGIKCMVM
jgi:hypothetical protein